MSVFGSEEWVNKLKDSGVAEERDNLAIKACTIVEEIGGGLAQLLPKPIYKLIHYSLSTIICQYKSNFIDLLNLVDAGIADPADVHGMSTLEAELVVIARPKVAVFLITPALSASTELTRSTWYRLAFFVLEHFALEDMLGFADSEDHPVTHQLFLLYLVPRTKSTSNYPFVV